MATLNLQVNASGNDGDQDQSGINGSITQTRIPIGSFNGNAHMGAARFLNVTIAQGTTITSAILTLKALSTYSTGSTISCIAYAEAADNAAIYTATNNNISGRTRTTANSGAKNIQSVTAEVDYTWDVTTAVQEVVNRAGWVSGNAVSILIRDNSSTSNEWQDFYTYDNTTTKAPKLDITYGAAAATSMVPPTPRTPFAILAR